MNPFAQHWLRHWRVITTVILAHIGALGALIYGWSQLPHEHVIPVDVQAVTLLAPQPLVSAAPREQPQPRRQVSPQTASQAEPTARSSAPSEVNVADVSPPPTPRAAQVAEVEQTTAVQLPSSRLHQQYNPKPPYPALSKRMGEQGLVMVRVWVEIDGAVSQGSIQTSSGHPRLDAVALSTVLRWRFTPGSVGGTSQAMWVQVPVRFVLE
jgi:protein TonB